MSQQYEHVQRWQQQQIAEMMHILQQLSPDFPNAEGRIPENWVFPLLKYTFVTISHAVEHDEADLIEQTLQFWETLSTNESNHFAYGPDTWLLMELNNCPLHADLTKLHQQDYRLYTEHAVQAGFQQVTSEYLSATWDLIEQAGYTTHVRDFGGVIVHQQLAEDPLTLTAYSNFFEGIVHTDWTLDPHYYAESIVHEAAHSLFNCYLELWQIDSGEKMYWSPWRREKRPAVGILHGTWAFTTVLQFYEQLYAKTQHTPYQDRVIHEAKRIQTAADSVREILRDINHPELTALFQELDREKTLFFAEK